MRILPLRDVRHGDVLASTLWAVNGQMAIREGSVLGVSHLNYLHSRGYTLIPIEYPGFEGICPTPWIDDELSKRVTVFLEHLPETFDLDADRAVKELAGKILGCVQSHPVGALELLPTVQSARTAVIVALNRALIVAAVGLGVLNDNRLLDTIVAALLLDSGPNNALSRGLIVDSDDPTVIEGMSVRAMAYLRKVDMVSSYTLAAIYQAYAHFDGSGVPPLKGDRIWQGAQLLAPANRIACLMAATSNRSAVAPHEALEWIMGGSGTEYAPEWVARIYRTVAPYAVGSVVQLSSGDVGVIAQVPPTLPGRPIVRILSGSYRGQEWDLRDRDARNVAILGLITTRDIDV